MFFVSSAARYNAATRETYDRHLADECQQRHIVCERCELPLVWSQLESHLQNECPKAEVQCAHGCGLAPPTT